MIIKTWISAMRLRTLPLAIASIGMGIALADLHQSANFKVGLLCLLTALLLQIISNLANDYGDFIKGTDNENRIGNMRALQSGIIKPNQMLIAIILVSVFAFSSGLSLLLTATNGIVNFPFLFFLAIGLVAIAAAIKYTVGKNAYGYSGLGDIAVFFFFGPVAVIGTLLLTTQFEFDWQNNSVVLLPTTAMGLLSTAVLNTNNIRDIENDRASGKYTIPVKIGLVNARLYHSFLIITASVCLLAYLIVSYLHWVQLLQLAALFLIGKTWLSVLRTPPSMAYNNLLKQLSLGALLFVVIFMITNWLARVYTISIVIKDIL